MSEITTSNKPHQHRGKVLLGHKFDVRLGAHIELRDQDAEFSAAPDALVYGVLESNVVNDRNVGRARIQSQFAEFQTVIDKLRNLGQQELLRFAKEVIETRIVEDNQTIPELEFHDLELVIETVNEGNFLWIKKTATEWIPLVTKTQDDELGVEYVTTETVVENVDDPYDLPANTKTAFHTYRQIDELRGILTTVTISGFDRYYIDDFDYTFPAILMGFEPLLVGLIPANKRSVYFINPIIRSAFTKMVHGKVRERFMTAAEVETILDVPPSGNGGDAFLAELVDFRPRDIQYSGELFNLNIPNVLTDDFSITATTDGDDEYYGAWSETTTQAESTPNASDYVADYIGEEKVVEDSINPWKFGLYVRKTVTIIMQ